MSVTLRMLRPGLREQFLPAMRNMPARPALIVSLLPGTRHQYPKRPSPPIRIEAPMPKVMAGEEPCADVVAIMARTAPHVRLPPASRRDHPGRAAPPRVLSPVSSIGTGTLLSRRTAMV